MKNYILAISLAVAFISCSKNETLEQKQARAQGDLQYTIQVDYLTEIWNGNTLHFDFTKNEQIHSKWMLDLWWGDANGNVPASGGHLDDVSGHGVRFTPVDPNDPDGEQVLTPFTWYMENNSEKIIANIGGNRAEITIQGGHVIIHQIATGLPYEVERIYDGHQVTNGLNMNGNGAKRPG